MPAESKAQQKFMGLVLALKTGEIARDRVSQSVKDAADSMTEEQIREFAGTKHKGLPEHKDSAPPEGNSQGQKLAAAIPLQAAKSISTMGKAEHAFGKFLSKALDKLKGKKAVTPVDDVVTIGKTRMGPIEAGIMSGTGVNKIVSKPVTKYRVNDYLNKHMAKSDWMPESSVADMVSKQTKQSKNIHNRLYTKGDVNAELPFPKNITKKDKALYMAAKYGPTALVGGYASNKLLSPSTDESVEIQTGWDGGDWSKHSSGNEILDKWIEKIE